MFHNSLINALVSAASKNQVGSCGQISGKLLGKGDTGWSGENYCWPLIFWNDFIKSITPRLGLHHHSGPSSIRRVIDGSVFIASPLA